MLLVRLNAASSTINVLSIPRDLQVDIPGFGIAKINTAYTDGGYNLLIKTIKQNVFPSFCTSTTSSTPTSRASPTSSTRSGASTPMSITATTTTPR